MHELPLNQAVGLLGLAGAQAPQLLAVVAHGDARTEQPLLWQLSTALSELGYSVSVLDGTVSESADNPGLQQRLDYGFGAFASDPDGPAWDVLPAASGLQALCGPGTRPLHSLQRLGQAFAGNTVLVLYAHVDVLVRLLANTELRPLLGVAGGKSSLLTSYLALKRLLRKARLEPTILNMMEDARQGTGAAAGVAQALRECARTFLAYEVHTIRIDPSQAEEQLGAAMRHLATGLLENALLLKGSAAGAGHAAGGSGELSRSH